MKTENLKKLETHLKTCMDPSCNYMCITDPQYVDYYFKIFFDEINAEGKPPHYDSFSDRLVLDKENKNYHKVINEFMIVWTAFGTMYEKWLYPK